MLPEGPALLALVILCAVVVEVALRFPFRIYGIRAAATTARAVRTMRRAGASDHWKERMLLACAGRLLGYTVTITAMIAGLVAIVGLMAVGIDRLLPGFGDFVLSWPGIVWSSGVATVLAVLRVRMLPRGL